MAGRCRLRLETPSEVLDASSTYCAKPNLSVKVLDFVQLGGPKWDGRPVFELRLHGSVSLPSLQPCCCSAPRRRRAKSHNASKTSGKDLRGGQSRWNGQ